MKLGYIGLGHMGRNMVLRLLDCGYELMVSDVAKSQATPLLDAGASWAETPADVAAEADLVLTSLPGPTQVEQVALGPSGLLQGMRPGVLHADLSTSSPTLIRRIDEAYRGAGGSAIDAPVSGGPEQCRAGTLVILAGGTAEQLQQAGPALDALSRQVLHIGPLGSGAVAKLVNNGCTMIGLQMFSEVISLGVKAGIDHRTLLGVIQDGAFGQGLPLTHVIPNVVFKHKFEPATFALDIGRKDVSLLTSLARELDVPMPITNIAEQNAVELVSRGFGGADTSIVFSLQESRAGVVMHDEDAAPLDLGGRR